MAVIRTAAAAEYGQLRQGLAEPPVEQAKLAWIAVIELLGFVQFGVAQA
jgi:hypothetical protein